MIVQVNGKVTQVNYIHVSILRQTPLPSRLLHNIEQSSSCYRAGPC